MEKKRIYFVGLIGLMLLAGLFLAGCKTDPCPGDEDCTVTFFLEGDTWSYINNPTQYKNCGRQTNNSEIGCLVADMMSSRQGSAVPRTGTHQCNCR